MNDHSPATGVESLPAITLPADCNYIGVFLTLHCNLRCSYCINRYRRLASRRKWLAASEWVLALNRLQGGTDLPISLQGGEPSLHPGFYDIINGIRPDLPIDLLTNLQFEVESFMARVAPARLKRKAPYASIRVSYHPETMPFSPLKAKVLRLLQHGYSVGIWTVNHPAWQEEIERARLECEAAGIDFRSKEFLGEYQGVLHGTYADEEALRLEHDRPVACRTTELLIGPNGNVYRCHSDLYAGRHPRGHLLDPAFLPVEDFLPCDHYGTCNPCDLKIKTNRFQVFGHTSVEIRHRLP